MSTELFNRYFWLMDVIYRSGGISREDINRKWVFSSLNERGEEELPERTFHRYRKAIESLFDVNIGCVDGKYKIEDVSIADSAKLWMLDSFAVNNLSSHHRGLCNRISVEEVPSSRKFLMPILDAMEYGKRIEVKYQSFYADEQSTFIVEPWGLKLHHQRWYMVGYSPAIDKTLVYGLDRIKTLTPSNETFKAPVDFCVDEWFKDMYGVNSYAPEFNHEPQNVALRVNASQIDYILSCPMHHTQKLTGEDTQGYIVKLRLVPSYDFIMELMKYGSEIEVIEPAALRKIMVNNLIELNKIYID